MQHAQPRRALVTGTTGFIGFHLAKRLKAEGWDVQAIVRGTSNAAAVVDLLSEEHIHRHDGSTDGMLAIMERAKPDVVFHLASLFLAGHTTADVSRLVESNVEFPAQLAEAMAVHKVPVLINTGTAWQHFENAQYNPVNLYAATKQACVDVLQYYVSTRAFKASHLELFDTYGPGDERPKLFTLLRKTAASGDALQMSAGEQLIDLVYVDDVVDAFVRAAEWTRAAGGTGIETFAVSSGAAMKLRDLVGVWSKVTGKGLNIQWGARPYRPREVMVPWTHGVPVPGWKAKMPLEEGIRRMEGIEGRGAT